MTKTLSVQTVYDIADKRNLDIQYVSNYGEPGYTAEQGVFLANWNSVPNYFRAGIERAGYATEWDDEWIIDYADQSCYRTMPDCYSWLPSYICNDWTSGEIIGKQAILDHKDLREDYIFNHLADDPSCADLFNIDLREFGFIQVNGQWNQQYKSGLYEHSDDDPTEMLRQFKEQYPDNLYVFQVDRVEQFQTVFSVFKLPNYWNS